MKTFFLAVLILIAPHFSVAQQAQSLCVTKKGVIYTRLKCKAGERKLSKSNLKLYGLKGEAGIQGPQGPSGVGISETLPSGRTITGFAGDTFFPTSSGVSTAIYVNFGIKTSVPVTNDNVIVKANNTLLTACGGNDFCLNSSDRDPTAQAKCTGTVEAPTAPPGHVCIYPISLLDIANNLQGASVANTPFGFQIFWIAGSLQKTSFIGTWAYTAP